jgi:class 3 adenylate cyclase
VTTHTLPSEFAKLENEPHKENEMQEKTPLKQVIYRSYRRSALIPIFTIELLLLLLYFTVNQYIGHVNSEAQLQDAQVAMQTIADKEAESITHQLLSVERCALALQREHEAFFKTLHEHPHANLDLNTPPTFRVAANGIYYKVDNGEGCSVYFGAGTQKDKTAVRKAAQSELLDLGLQSAVDGNPLISAAYLNTWDELNRYYPFIPKVYEQFAPDIQMEDFGFYYEADALHNPERGVQWTAPYLDPAGLGWMLSCVVPVYYGDFLEGVIGLDITVGLLAKQVLDLNLPWQGGSMLLTHDGTIAALSPALESVVGLKELVDAHYDGPVKQEVDKPDEFNIRHLPSPAVSAQLLPIFEAKTELCTVSPQERSYLLLQNEIKQAQLRLFSFVDEEALLAPVRSQGKLVWRMGLLVLAAMIVFYLIFFAYLLRQSSALAKRVAKPMVALSKATHLFSVTQDLMVPKSSGVEEIDALSDDLTGMMHSQSNSFNQIRRLNESYSRFVPREFLRHLGQDNIMHVRLADQVQKHMAVLCIDIRGFTKLAESMDPASCFAFINRYTQRMAPLVRRHGGFIDKYIGDGILSLFESPQQGLRAAVAMLDSIDSMNEELLQEGRSTIELGVGLHVGDLVMGIIGDPGRLEGTVISDAVNLADHIQELNKVYGTTFLVTEAVTTQVTLADDLEIRRMGQVRGLGRQGVVAIREVFQAKTLKGQRLMEIREAFHAALDHYQAGQIEDALDLFQTCLRKNPHDRASLYYCKHCERLLKTGLPQDWDGVTHMSFES